METQLDELRHEWVDIEKHAEIILKKLGLKAPVEPVPLRDFLPTGECSPGLIRCINAARRTKTLLYMVNCHLNEPAIGRKNVPYASGREVNMPEIAQTKETLLDILKGARAELYEYMILVGLQAPDQPESTSSGNLDDATDMAIRLAKELRGGIEDVRKSLARLMNKIA